MTAATLSLLMTADGVGGVWQYATALAGALTPLGIRTTIAQLGPPLGDVQRALVPPGIDLIETGLPLDWLADGPDAVRAASCELARLARGFDIVQLNSPTLAAARFPVPTVVVAHGCVATWWERAGEGALPAELAWSVDLARAGLRAANMVVAPTHAFAEQLTRLYQLTERPLSIHNGRARLAEVAPASHAAPVFTAGRLWDRAKDAALLDRVAARLDAPFAAAGPTQAPHGERLEARHLRLLGLLPEPALAAQLASRPVFVSAATFEPFGLAVLEAAQAGCPLVLSDIPSFRELWGEAASFVPAGDEDGFVDAIGRLLADPVLHAAQGAAARSRARRYTPEATARAMAALFRRSVEQRAAA